MEQRYLKIGLSLSVGLLALFWLANNLLNWSMAHGAVAYILSQADQGGYPVHLVPPIHSPLISTIVLVLILAAEAAAAFLSLLGVGRMWKHRLDARSFAGAKRPAILGAGIAALLWFLLFQVFGGTLLLMGQNESGVAVLEGAFRFASYAFLTLIYLSLSEPELGHQ